MMSERMLVFIGSYADAADPGIYVYDFDRQTARLTLLDQVSGLKNPTFLKLDAAGRKLYSIAEGLSDDGQKIAEAICFSIDSSNGKIKELNRAKTVDAPTCHIQSDNQHRFLTVASYHGGLLGLVSLQADGLIGECLDVKQHEGHGANPQRQNEPHPHSSYFSPDNRFIFVPDLGIDRIRSYTVGKNGKLQSHGDTVIHPGAGPRHMAFHPSGKYAFVINELDSTVVAFRYNPDLGILHAIETVSTLPESFGGENGCAEIAVSENGRFLYGSNRGHDSIVVYAIDPDSGKLALVEHVSTEGRHPRHFTLIPGNDFLIAANRDNHNIAVFRVDQESGKLAFTGVSAEISKPVCVKAAYFQE